jgi:hypothetical protein
VGVARGGGRGRVSSSAAGLETKEASRRLEAASHVSNMHIRAICMAVRRLCAAVIAAAFLAKWVKSREGSRSLR